MKCHTLSCEMDFLTYFVVFLFSLQIQGIKSDDDCVIDDFPNWDENKQYTLYTVEQNLKKTDIGNVVLNKTCHNIKDVKITSDAKLYFDISFQDETKTRLIMTANEKLSNIDKDYRHIEKSSVSTTTMIKFTCNNNKDRQAQFTVNVDDVNTKGPEFSKPNYEFQLPMPMPAKISLTMFGDNPIMVRDQDFSTTDIAFTSDYENLVFQSTYDGSKDNLDDFPYTLEMTFSSFTKLEDDKTIKVYATDNGHPDTKTSVIEISFLIDHQQSEYMASFKQPSFLYDYDQDEGRISAEDIDVTIENPRDDIECEIEEPYQDYFETPVLTENVVGIQLKGKLPDDIVSQKTVRVTVTCSIKNNLKSSADVLISIPEISVLFSQSTYNAKYIIEQGVYKVDMTDEIEVIGNTDHIVIEVENNFHDYFEVDHTNGSNKWLLKKTKDLPKELLDSISLNIVVDIKSSSGTFRDKAIITLLLPNGQIGVKFTNSFVTGDYVVDENGQGKLTADIQFDLNSENVKVNGERLLGDYNEYFNVNYQEPNTFTVALRGDLPKEALKSNTIFLTLQVDLGLGAVSQTAEATFVVQISDSGTTTEPPTTTEQPTTSKPTEPTTSKTEHTTSKTEQTTSKTEHTMSKTEHTTKGTETTDRQNAPTVPTNATTQSPTVTTGKTDTPTKEPTAPTVPTNATTQSPTVTTGKTDTPTKEPTAPTVPTNATTQSPTVTTGKTDTPTKEPTAPTVPTNATTQSPTVTTGKTDTPTKEPTAPTVPTNATTQSPTVTTGKTDTPTKEPTAPTVPTNATTQSPTVTTGKTDTPTKEPTAPTVPTNATTQSPTVTTEKTDTPTKEPTEHTTQHPTESTTKKAETTDDCDQTVWIAVTIVLSSVLVLYVGASLLYYFKKLRNREINHDFPPEPNEEIEDRYKKKASHLKSSLRNVATRRATGYVRYNPDADKEDDSEKSDNETEHNTIANREATPSPPPMPTTDHSKNDKDENTTESNETLADALKKAVLERESRLI